MENRKELSEIETFLSNVIESTNLHFSLKVTSKDPRYVDDIENLTLAELLLKFSSQEVSRALEKQKGEIERLLSKLLQYEFAFKSENDRRELTEVALLETQTANQTLREALEEIKNKVTDTCGGDEPNWKICDIILKEIHDFANSALSSTSHNSKEETLKK